MAYAERRERKKGVRYRGIYKAADGRYQSAGTFSTEERALAVALEAERHAAEVAGGRCRPDSRTDDRRGRPHELRTPAAVPPDVESRDGGDSGRHNLLDF